MPVLSGDKWVTPGREFPTVTWSFATANYDLSDQYFGYLDFDGQISAEYRPLVRSAFDAWEAVSMIDFVEVPDDFDVNIRIGDIEIDGFPRPGETTTLGTAQSWTVSGIYVASQIYFDVDAYEDRETFYQVTVHEIGHAIGLDHSDDPADTMYYLSNELNASGRLSAGDISGVQQIYGARAVGPTIDTDFATAAASLFFLGALPTAAQLDARGNFADAQYDYYANVLKVANPEIGPYEAFGNAFSRESAFVAKYGTTIDTTTFVREAYEDVFHRAPSAAQTQHFIGQVEYFRSLYVGAGIGATQAELQARGAAAGQMLGFAMTNADERAMPAQTLDDTVSAYLARSSSSAVSLAGMSEEPGMPGTFGLG